MRKLLAAVLSLAPLLMRPENAGAQAPTLAVVNARVWTGDPRRPWADAVAAAGDRIVAVGSGAEVRKLVSPATRVVDARGMMVVPGFIDTHVHFLSGGFGLSSAQRPASKTPGEFVARMKG